MSRDLEEFLRMAAARRQAEKGNAPPPPQQRQPQRQPQRPVQQPRRRVPPPIVEAEVIEEIEIIEPLRSTIQSSINTQDIQAHVAHLGERIASAGEQIEDEIHKKFDHEVSRLDDNDSQRLDSPTGGKAQTASEFAQLFANPKSIAQAIVMREILDRPKFD